MDEIKVTQLNKNSSNDWERLEEIALDVFPNKFRKFLADSGYDLKNYKVDGYNFLDDALFLEKNDKKVGVALVNRQHAIFGDVEVRPDTLYLSYLMMLDEESGKGYGTTLLKGVLDYAKQNGFKYVELINTVNLDFFREAHNIYFQNNFKALALYSPKNRSNQNNFNIYFRIDVDSNLANLSKALYASYSRLSSLPSNQITEVILKQELEKQYVDILSLTKPLSKQELKELKTNPIFADLTITLSQLLKNKGKEQPESDVRNAVKVGKILKTLNMGLSKKSNQSECVPNIYHFDKVDRILCGFADERINQETLNEIGIQQKYGK